MTGCRALLSPHLGCSIVCIADDTLLIAEGQNRRETKMLAKTGLVCVVPEIKDLEFRVAAHKTEALLFCK